MTNLFKVQVGRLRPCFDSQLKDMIRLVKLTCGGKFSFFSVNRNWKSYYIKKIMDVPIQIRKKSNKKMIVVKNLYKSFNNNGKINRVLKNINFTLNKNGRKSIWLFSKRFI